MNKLLNLKSRVMFQIYFEYAKNMVLNYPDYFMLAIFISISFISVSVYDVLFNAVRILENDLASFLGFILAAIRNTSLIIQTLILGFIIRVVFISSKFTGKKISMGSDWIMAKIKY